MVTPADVVTFWGRAGPERWFSKDPAFDAEIRARFEAAHFAAARRELDGWADAPEGALALMLLLDQFPRNLFRASAHQFATDPLARMFAERALAAGHDRETGAELRRFFYLPFEHSEDAQDQDRAVALCEASGDEDALLWAHKHQEVIRRFGRFPHRNAALGRETSPEEQAYLDAGGGF
ncbi:MAG: DUF924 family protein [Pseudomonadota bacterium]|nr:DUF924 family protein [Pseudomonadota bacterium]